MNQSLYCIYIDPVINHCCSVFLDVSRRTLTLPSHWPFRSTLYGIRGFGIEAASQRLPSPRDPQELDGIYRYIYIYVYLCIYIYVICIYICIYIYTYLCILYMYIYIYMYTDTHTHIMENSNCIDG